MFFVPRLPVAVGRNTEWVRVPPTTATTSAGEPTSPTTADNRLPQVARGRAMATQVVAMAVKALL
jgi:hypothetical protein